MPELDEPPTLPPPIGPGALKSSPDPPIDPAPMSGLKTFQIILIFCINDKNSRQKLFEPRI